MRRLLLPVMVLACVEAQASRPPGVKIQRGFASLQGGSWEGAFRDWNEEGVLSFGRMEELRQKLSKLGAEPRGMGEQATIHPPLGLSLWQRHWVMATFDRAPVFFCFDFQYHKDEWRLFRIEVTENPQDILPNVDLKSLPAQVRSER